MKIYYRSKVLLVSTLVLLFLNTYSQKEDWAYLEKYRDENSTITVPKKGENRVIFIGSSGTQLWKDKSPEFFADNPYINRGTSGQVTPQMLVRFRQDVIALQPTVVVILAGINDVFQNRGPDAVTRIEDNLASMAELANANGIQVVLSSLMPVNQKSDEVDLKQRIIEVNTWINAFCEKRGFIYLDYYTAMKTDNSGLKPELTYDGLHCTTEGYKVMEPLVQDAISNALKMRPATDKIME